MATPEAGRQAGERGLLVTGAATALFAPLLRPWRPLSTWFTMLTTVAFDLGVILVLRPR